MVPLLAFRVLWNEREGHLSRAFLSHGFVVDGKGMKMSKSAGNVILPEDILKNYGADITKSLGSSF